MISCFRFAKVRAIAKENDKPRTKMCKGVCFCRNGRHLSLLNNYIALVGQVHYLVHNTAKKLNFGRLAIGSIGRELKKELPEIRVDTSSFLLMA